MLGTRLEIGPTLPPLASVEEKGGEGPVLACLAPLWAQNESS
jgi:hypothetical protein